MKRFLLFALIVAAAIAGLVFAYREMSREKEAEMEGEKPVSAPSRAKRGTNGEAILTLDVETQKRIQLKVEPLAPATLPREQAGYARVLDPTLLAALAAEFATAQAALVASSKELERLKALQAQDQNASIRAVEAAEAVAQRDQINLRSVRDRIELAWGRAFAEQADLPAFIRSLVAQQAALVRVDLPAGETASLTPAGARLELLSETNLIEASILGPAPNTHPEMQGEAFLLLVKPRPPRLTPGVALKAFLALSGEPLRGVVVPREAVLRMAGKSWVFVQTSKETFARREIALDHPTTNGWFVVSGLASDDRVVVSGAQTLLSEELKSQMPVLAE